MRKNVKNATLFDIIPEELSAVVKNFAARKSIQLKSIEEIRVRAEKKLIIRSGGRSYQTDFITDSRFLTELLNLFTGYSYYAYEEQMSEGYITIGGGHRIGVCGKCVIENNKIKLIKNPTSLNIRQAREMTGCADDVIPHLIKKENGAPLRVMNTLIVSPPKCGKTTLLRDIIRQLSNAGFAVGVCDERSEISGMANGVPIFDLGANTDILDACPKREGMNMMIRAMSPDVLATDEIGSESEVDALRNAVNCGVSVLATMHGNNAGKMPAGIFERIVTLSAFPQTGTVKEIKYV